jgi:DNA-directed RNA polymerase subunit L
MNTNKDVEMAEAEKLNIMTDKDEPHLNATYSFHGEDHTLGNLLRNILIKE